MWNQKGHVHVSVIGKQISQKRKFWGFLILKSSASDMINFTAHRLKESHEN